MEQLVGRDAEMQAVRQTLETSRCAGIVLEGEAGIGKTAIWDAGITEAADRGMRVVVARPAEAETSLSHAALDDILGATVDELPDDFPAPQRRALDIALLRTSADGGSLDPRAVGAATLGALRAAAAAAPMLIAVDDIQWLDSASAAAMRFALRRLDDGDPVMLLATRRADAGADALDVGFAGERLTRIAVGPLDSDALERVLRDQLGETVARPAVARLAEISGGNPYYALELARAALRHAGGTRLGEDIPLPEGILSVLETRLRALPPETAEALGTVAAMGHPTMSSVAETVDPRTLDVAFGARVLHERGETIRFDHPLLAEAAYRMLPPSRRRAVHLRLAERTPDAEERAHHLASGSTAADAGVAAAIERGAEAAAERGGPAAAAELLEASARLEPETETAARRRIAAVGHHMAAGDSARAAALGRALVEELPAGPLRARALNTLAALEGNVLEMIAFARQAVAEAGDDHEVLIRALLWEAVLLVFAERHDEGHTAILRARELCRSDDPRTVRVMVLTNYGYLAHLRGEGDALEVARQAAELEGDGLIPNAGWSPGTVVGRILMSADALEDARSILEERHRRAREVGDDESRSAISRFLAETDIRAGCLEAALGYAGDHGYCRAMVAAYQGEVGLARELAERELAESEARVEGFFAAANRAALGFLELSLGDTAAAVERFRPVVKRFQSGEGGDPGLRHNIAVPDAIEALVACGELEEAEVLLAAWRRAGEAFDRPRIHATAERSRALLAAAAGDLELAVRHAEAALGHHRDLPVPFERARTLIVLGTLYRRTKHKAAARAALDEAVDILDRMGAPLWSDRARAELGRIGGRAASDGLTPTEERVADLVAEGRSNKEVAGALFVSVRTVEANLTRIYAKLGIRSRTELASRRGR